MEKIAKAASLAAVGWLLIWAGLVHSPASAETVSVSPSASSLAAWTDGYPFRENLVVNPGNRTIADTVASIANSPLSETERISILRQYSIETLAHDVYVRFYQLYGISVFDSAARAKQEHADAVRLLATRYGLSLPAGYGEYQSVYDTIRTQGEVGVKEALESSVRIEEYLIDQLSNSIKMTDSSDVATVFAFIGDASFGQLRTHLRTIIARDSTTNVSAEGYLSLQDVLSAPNFQGRLVQRLRKAAEAPPCGQCSRPTDGSSYVGWENRYHSEVQRQYRNAVENKYGPRLRNMGRYSLQAMLARVDAAIENLENRALSAIEKEKQLNAYQALREYIVQLLGK